MGAIFRTLAEEAARLNVVLDEEAIRRFALYHELLVRWNQRMNLTRIVDEEDVVAKHFLDSLAIVPHLGFRATGLATLIDVGSGAGFPGVPAAIACPSLAVTLVESVQKKCSFLEAVGRELGLSLSIVARRAESVRMVFDVAVSRATLSPPRWVELGARLVAPGGTLIAMLGRERFAFSTPPGFRPPAILPYSLPCQGERALAVFRHIEGPV